MKRILVVDVGGTTLKVFPPQGDAPILVPSGPRFTPRAMMNAVRKAVARRPFDAVSIGVPTLVGDGKITAEPPHLGRGWKGFDFAKAFGKPVKVVNDAVLQALGSYQGGTMLFLGLGTGLGSALVVEGSVMTLELCDLPFRRGTFEQYLGTKGFERFGARRWRQNVAAVAPILKAATVADYVVLGGGRAALLSTLPEGCRLGDNLRAFEGGKRLWS
jgi:predicted NBD/HSP70 family sugar kinase